MDDRATNQHPHLAVTARNDRESPLLRLPGELRTRVYEYVLAEGLHRMLGYRQYRSPRQLLWNRHPTPLAILKVCRRIYIEAALLPFSLNTFNFLELKHVANDKIQRLLNLAQRSAIRSVRCEIYSLSSPKVDKFLDDTARAYTSLTDVFPGVCHVEMVARGRAFTGMWDRPTDSREMVESREGRARLEAWLKGGSAVVNVKFTCN